MLAHRRFSLPRELNNNWLHAKHHFANHTDENPEHAALGPLVVWDDNEIAVDGGFPMHQHRDMEIITYVRQGVLDHRDTLGSSGTLCARDVQVMSAGTGNLHSEFNGGQVPLKTYQISLLPRAGAGVLGGIQGHFPAAIEPGASWCSQVALVTTLTH